MKGIVHILVLIVFVGVTIDVASGQVPFTCEGQLFLTLEPDSGQQLVQINIDPFTNEAVFSIISPDIGVTVNAIGYRFTDNLIYGVDPINHILYRIDAMGTVETIKQLDLSPGFQYFAGDITLNGVFFDLVGVQDGFRTEFVRINLADGDYTITQNEVSELLRIFDIAFDPFTGVLYGYDSGPTGQLVILDELTGEVTRRFPRINIREAAGLFFDAFGNLYAYGGNESNNTVFRVDKTNGTFAFYAAGTPVQNADAASCPYTIEIIKEVSPEVTVPCSEVIYTFTIANGAGRTIGGIDFEDRLPEGFEVLEIIQNPFQGELDQSTGPGVIKIDDMTIPKGIDSIRIRVEIPEVPPGFYANQATLNDLPMDLGDFRVSDNPNTPAEDDSTVVQVLGTPWDSLFLEVSLCDLDGEVLDASPYGSTYLWSTNATTPQITVRDANLYSVIAQFGCDTNYIAFNVMESSLSTDLSGDREFDIKLGDSILLAPIIVNAGVELSALWTDPLGNSLSCTDCTETWARPFFDTKYVFTIQNEFGCMDSLHITFRVDKTRNLYIPNVFTPNGDGLNDFFFIQSTDFGILHQFTVFNRWGDQVYDGDQVSLESGLSWDGRYKGTLVDPAVFVWIAEIEFLDGVRESFSGDVTVLR